MRKIGSYRQKICQKPISSVDVLPVLNLILRSKRMLKTGNLKAMLNSKELTCKPWQLSKKRIWNRTWRGITTLVSALSMRVYTRILKFQQTISKRSGQRSKCLSWHYVTEYESSDGCWVICPDKWRLRSLSIWGMKFFQFWSLFNFVLCMVITHSMTW